MLLNVVKLPTKGVPKKKTPPTIATVQKCELLENSCLFFFRCFRRFAVHDWCQQKACFTLNLTVLHGEVKIQSLLTTWCHQVWKFQFCIRDFKLLARWGHQSRKFPRQIVWILLETPAIKVLPMTHTASRWVLQNQCVFAKNLYREPKLDHRQHKNLFFSGFPQRSGVLRSLKNTPQENMDEEKLFSHQKRILDFGSFWPPASQWLVGGHYSATTLQVWDYTCGIGTGEMDLNKKCSKELLREKPEQIGKSEFKGACRCFSGLLFGGKVFIFVFCSFWWDSFTGCRDFQGG